MTAVAAIGPHSRPRAVMNPAITTGNVLDLLTLSIHANKNSFHAPTNASIADAIIPGFVNGKIILKNLFVNPQPSNIADSSSSFGSCSKNPIINQITSGRLKLVFIIISAVFVSIRCIVLITRYTGIAVAIAGYIFWTINHSPKYLRARFPRLPLATAYAAILPNITEIIVEAPATTTVLKKFNHNWSFPKISW